MGLPRSNDGEARFSAYVEGLTSVIGHQAAGVDRHLCRHEQEVAGLHRLRLVTKCHQNAGVDVALLRGAAGLRREYVDLDRAVIGR